MGMFFGGDDDHYLPGVRRSGFPRYREILEGNYKEFFLNGFIALVFHIPFAAGMVYAVSAKSALAAILAGIVGGAAAAPGVACMEDLILRRMRDDKADWWVLWKRSMKQNTGASLLPGIVQYAFLSLVIFAAALMLWGRGSATPGTVFLLAGSTLLGIMILNIWWPQVVLFVQRPGQQVKNAVFFCIYHFGRVLVVSLLEAGFWLIMFLFLPWTAFVVPVIGIWYIRFLALHLLYPDLDDDFRIEEQIEEMKEQKKHG